MTDKQPVALALAAFLEQFRSFPDDLAAAAELRRLHAENEAKDALLRQALEAMEQAHDESLDEDHFECRSILSGQIAALRERLGETK